MSVLETCAKNDFITKWNIFILGGFTVTATLELFVKNLVNQLRMISSKLLFESLITFIEALELIYTYQAGDGIVTQ